MKLSQRPLRNPSSSSHLPPYFVQPNQNAHFLLKTDVSGYITGAVLSQLCKDDKWHLIVFMSKSLSDTERNNEIHSKELLSVI